MITKAEATARLAELKAAALEPAVLKDGTPEGMAALFAPVEAALNTYYTGDGALRQALQYAINQQSLDQINRHMVYEHQELLPPFPSESTAPTGYSNISELFNGGGALDDIMSITAPEFVAAFAYSTSSTADAGGTANATQEIPESNSRLTAWAAQLTGARAGEMAGLQRISDFCESGSYNAGLCMLFEELGEIIDSIKTDALAVRIYLTGGYKSVITEMGLDVYIPVLLR